MMIDNPLRVFLITIAIFLVIIVIVYTIFALLSRFLSWINSFKDYSKKKIKLHRVDSDSKYVRFYSTYWGWQDNKYNYLKELYPIGTILVYEDKKYFVLDHYQVHALVETYDNNIKESLYKRQYVYKTTPVTEIEINSDNRSNLETHIGNYINQGDDKTSEILQELSQLISVNINQMTELKDVIISLDNNLVNKNVKKNIFEIIKNGMEFGLAAHDIIENVLKYWV